jgi:hypothetical protein
MGAPHQPQPKEYMVRLFLSLTGACAAGVLVFATAGLAGQSVTQTLNPPPPSYEICKAVGEGTICQGTTTFSEGPIDTADEGLPLVCGSGASAFDAYDSFVDNSLARRIYDGNGDLVKRYRYDTSDGRYSNPLTGASVGYTSTLTNVDNLSVPGGLGSAIEQTTGQFIVKPGHGSPVLMQVGRSVTTFEPDFSLDFQAGPNDFFDYAFGDTSVLGPLCTTLGA